eukprot:6793139-Pyramimonas_sp.AAC.1
MGGGESERGGKKRTGRRGEARVPRQPESRQRAPRCPRGDTPQCAQVRPEAPARACHASRWRTIASQ